MAKIPESVAQFLRLDRVAVAGVSRDPSQPANAMFRRLRDAGMNVVPVNPWASTLEGVQCYHDLASIPEPVQGLLVATAPGAALELVRQCAERGVRFIWFHRSIGEGSLSPYAVKLAKSLGLQCIEGGCPLMYCEPVDPFHRCMCAVLRWRGRVPA